MKIYRLLFLLILISCAQKDNASTRVNIKNKKTNIKNSSIVILGTIQDAGSPQIGCNKNCCKNLFNTPDNDRQVISLGLIDKVSNKTYLFEATPDIGRQIKTLSYYKTGEEKEFVDAIFLTHAHIGHYAGLMFLGKEAANTNNIPVYTMPRMKEYLTNNGPWSQLVTRKNILLKGMEDSKTIHLSKELKITPFLVPHRDEYSETVGYKISGPNKTALFIPDIDKWNKWEKDIIEEIKKVDYAFLDATFYSGKEINNRDITQIPHPFIIESLDKFKDLGKTEKNKVIFIHFNHTNPVINPNSEEAKLVKSKGFKIGEIYDTFEL